MGTSGSWQVVFAWFGVILAVGAVGAGCGSRNGTGNSGGLGTVRASLTSDAPADVAAAVRIDVAQAGAVVGSQTVALAPLTLPSGQPAVGGDAVFTVRPGSYGVSATALDATGAPSAACATSMTTATVAAGLTTEIMLSVLCNGGGTGGLDVTVTVGAPPVITDLQITPGKYIQTTQPVDFKAVASSPGHDLPLVYQWSVASTTAAVSYQLNQFGALANFTASNAGDYSVTLTVTDTQGRVATLNFPVHVADMPRRPTRVTQRPCRTGDESLPSFAARCDKAMGGVTVPAFDCEDGASTEPPRQDDGSGACGAPNVLNSECDPGSHFHVLHRNVNNDGIYVLTHCRKQTAEGESTHTYGDVTAFQYNSNTGAACFYQALKFGLPHNAPAPSSGDLTFWLSPAQTASIRCVQCHDNGPLIRSPYLAQLGEVWPFFADENNPNNPARPNLPAADANYLPGTLQGDIAGPWNTSMPYMFVGLNFQSWEAYSVTNSADPTCTSCHRMGISRSNGFWNGGAGTSQDFGIRATAMSQSSKLSHGNYAPGTSSPIWMTPGQISYDAMTAGHATAMQSCAQAIINGSPPTGCSATRIAQGDTCPPPPVVVNGSTTAGDPKSWKTSGKMPLGQPGGRIGFYFFTTVHGPFYQNTPWDPYMNAPPSVANPPWDPPTQAPGFRGTYLRIYGEPPGQWTVAWGLDATDIQNNNNTPPPPGGPGGEIDGVSFDQIDSVPDAGNCGSGYHAITDQTGNNSPLTTTVDNPAGGSAAILAGFIGNVARGSGDPASTVSSSAILQVHDVGAFTVLSQVHTNNPTPAVNQWFTGESWANGCANWQASMHYAAHHVQSTNDVLLVPTADVPNTICYIDGVGGDWSQWRTNGNGGSLQPYAQIYIDPNSGYRLKVWPDSSDAAGVSAFATCVYLKN